MAVTIKEVAKAANVSPSTVSRVLADNPRISEETKNKVHNAVKMLNYHPNAIARSLASSATKTLGLILPNEADELFKNPFFIQAMAGISIYAQRKGYYIMYAFGKSEKEEVGYIRNYTNSRLVDGIILLTARKNDRCIKFLKEKEYPFVVIGRPEDTEGVLWVDNDNLQSMYNTVNYIIEKGHRDIGFIGGPADMNMSQDRLDGYKRALQTHGIHFDSKLTVQEENFNEECGYRGMKKIMEYKIPSAVVTSDDLLAFGALKAIKERKELKISVAGFNNTPLAAFQTPALTSVDINAEELGYHAARLLIEKLENCDMVNDHHIVETNLIERESTK